MRTILHLQTNLNISCGVSKIIYLILKHQSSEFRHDVISLGGDGIERFNSSQIYPKVIRYNRNAIYGTVRIFLYILDYSRRNNVVIIHSHHRYFDLLTYIISKIIDVKTITTVHSITKGKRFLSYKSDLLICNSNSVKTHLINYFKINANKIKVIPNFIDPEEVKVITSPEKIKAQLGIQGKKIIGYIGRIDVEEKGIDILLNACKKLSVFETDLSLLLIGNGTSTEFARNYFDKEKFHVIHIGPQTKIFDFYNIMDIIVLPSRTETFGLVILETGLMKKTFVGSKIGGISEVVKNNYDGLLFSPGDSDELSKILIRLMNDDSLCKTFAKNLNTKVVNNYSADKIIPFYDTLYKKYINESE